MTIRKPAYFDRFRCIAGACPDSCCKEWEVLVDEESAAYYRSLPGDLGDRLRQVLRDEDGKTYMTIENHRCPMWRADGLCRIQAELGEEALCQVCGSFPRLRHDYGSFAELGLELSCPEAARLILEGSGWESITAEDDEPAEACCDEEAMESLLASRKIALSLFDRYPAPRALALLLVYGYQAQEELDGCEAEGFDTDSAIDTIRSLAKEGELCEFLNFFTGLELLTEDWKQRLEKPAEICLPEGTAALAHYLIGRYWLQSVSDYDLTCRVKFIVISCLLVGLLGGDFRQTAQIFSKEIENDADNVDAILDAAYTCAAFTDDKLLGMLLKGGSL